jgi:hypothetical protein
MGNTDDDGGMESGTAADAPGEERATILHVASQVRVGRCDDADCSCGRPIIVLYDAKGHAFAMMPLLPAEAYAVAQGLVDAADTARARREVEKQARKH